MAIPQGQVVPSPSLFPSPRFLSGSQRPHRLAPHLPSVVTIASASSCLPPFTGMLVIGKVLLQQRVDPEVLEIGPNRCPSLTRDTRQVRSGGVLYTVPQRHRSMGAPISKPTTRSRNSQGHHGRTGNERVTQHLDAKAQSDTAHFHPHPELVAGACLSAWGLERYSVSTKCPSHDSQVWSLLSTFCVPGPLGNTKGSPPFSSSIQGRKPESE